MMVQVSFKLINNTVLYKNNLNIILLGKIITSINSEIEKCFCVVSIISFLTKLFK